MTTPTYHDIQAKLIAPRSGAGRPFQSRRSTPTRTARLYCLNVYTNDFQDKTWLPPGTVKTLRLLEGVSRQASDSAGTTSRAVLPPLASRRILGEVPVAPDGSFNVEVPANMPVELQLVDENGLTLRSCGWVWTHNHFNQGCIGCHEDPELTPENLMVDALKSPSVVVAPPVEQRRSIDFRRDLMPIVTQKCLPCHAQGGSPPDLTAGTPAPADVADAGFRADRVRGAAGAGGGRPRRATCAASTWIRAGRGPAPWSGISWAGTRLVRGMARRLKGSPNRSRRMRSNR